MEFRPHRYQRTAVRRMVRQGHMGLFLDPGLGKTVIVLTAFQDLRDNFEAERMLVVAPLAVCYNVWRQEAEKWDHTRDLRVQLIHGKYKGQAILREADVYLVNPEGVPWLVEQDWNWPDMLVIDESTKFKKPGTRRFRALRKVLGRFDRRYILTGTPTPNGLLDLFGQMYCVDQGHTLGRSMTDYKQEYFVPIPRGNYYDWVPRRNADKMIYERIGSRILRMEGTELDLPGLVVSDIPIELPPAARTLYDTLRQEMVAQMEQGEVLALNAGALTGKCRQLANGRVYIDDLPGGDEQRPDGHAGGRPFACVHDAKVEALGRLIEELGGKHILFSYEYLHDLVAIRKALGRDVPMLKGSDSALVTQWNRGLVPYMVAHPKSAGHGLNLQTGGHVLVMLGPPWDLELYQQMIRRLYRQGQTERVLVYRLVARGTVDETAARTLQRKDVNQRALLDALREDLA